MAVVYITETELVRDVHAVLEKVRQGVGVAIEEDHRPVAVLAPPKRFGRKISEIVREARAKSPEASQRRRSYIEELVKLVPIHPATAQTAYLAGQIEGQEAAKGNVLPFNDLLIASSRY